MARCKSSPEAVRAKCELADRMRLVRVEQFGERGGPELARRLNLPVRTWYNYEVGVTVPAEVLLRFIELTGVEPMWLLHGKGPRFRRVSAPITVRDDDSPESLQALLRMVLSRLEQQDEPEPVTQSIVTESDEHRSGSFDDFVMVRIEDSDLPHPNNGAPLPSALPVHRDWLGNEKSCRCVRVRGDAMTPTLPDGTIVAYRDRPEESVALDGQLVVVRIDGCPMVRRLQHAGRFALLRTENPAAEPTVLPIDLEDPSSDGRQFRRVLWACAPH